MANGESNSLNSLIFLQLVKAVKTSTGYCFVCTTEERLHNHFLTQKTVTTSPGSWHHSKPSSLLNVTEFAEELRSQSVS